MSAAATPAIPGFFVSFVFGKAWKAFKEHWLVLFGFSLLYFAIICASMMGLNYLQEQGQMVFYAIAYIAYLILNMILGMGMIKITLKITRDQKVVFSDLFSSAPHLLKYFVGTLLTGLVVLGGLLLFIVPGIIWSIKYMFTPYLIVDKGLGPIAAMKMSAKMTNGVKWDIIAFEFASVLFIYMGFFALLIGTIITVPVAALAGVIVYSLLLARVEKEGKE